MHGQSNKANGRIPKFYLYKTTVDDGDAPCVQDRMLTLAIRKPTIRRVAPEGSVIIAFAGDYMGSDGYEDNSIVYAAVVSKGVPNSGCWRYAHWRDCVYGRAGT